MLDHGPPSDENFALFFLWIKFYHDHEHDLPLTDNYCTHIFCFWNKAPWRSTGTNTLHQHSPLRKLLHVNTATYCSSIQHKDKGVSIVDGMNASPVSSARIPGSHSRWPERSHALLKKGLGGGLEWISLILTSRGREKGKAMT